MANRKPKTQIAPDGKRYPVDNFPIQSTLPISRGLQVFGEPTENNIPVWTSGRRAEWAEPVAELITEDTEEMTVLSSTPRGFLPGPVIASRCVYPRKGFSTGVTQVNSRMRHTVMTDAYDLRFCYVNAEQSDNTNAIVIRAGLEIPAAPGDGSASQASSAKTAVTFNGKRDVTIEPGQFVISDIIPIEVLAGRNIFSITRQVVQTDQKLVFSHWYASPGFFDGRNTNDTDYTTSGSFNLNAEQYQPMYGPCAIVGQPRSGQNPPFVLLIGDSIMASESPLSFGDQALTAARIPHVLLARTGEQANYNFQWPQRKRRMVLATGATHAIVQYGVNDISSNVSAATLKSALINIWRALQMRGIKVTQTTITPHTTSTNNWTTIEGQTPWPQEAQRVNFNDWIRSGAPLSPTNYAALANNATDALRIGDPGHPLIAYFEIADSVESSRNSGRWRTDIGTTDGLHPGSPGHSRMRNAIDTSVFV